MQRIVSSYHPTSMPASCTPVMSRLGTSSACAKRAAWLLPQRARAEAAEEEEEEEEEVSAAFSSSSNVAYDCAACTCSVVLPGTSAGLCSGLLLLLLPTLLPTL